MPLYDYKCGQCGHVERDVFRRMMSEAPEPCRVCSAPMGRVPTLPHTDLREFHTPIEMYSIAMDSDQEIREFKRKAGDDVDVSTDPADPMYGIPIARNRKQKLRALDAAGFVEKK